MISVPATVSRDGPFLMIEMATDDGANMTVLNRFEELQTMGKR